MMANRRVSKPKSERTIYKVAEGAVSIETIPEEIVEIETPEEGKPQVRFSTPDGEAIYEYAGDCWDCNQQKIVTPVFVCKSHPVRADEQLGNQVASFWVEGGGVSAPLCLEHYHQRLGDQPQREMPYKVIERRW